MLEIPFNSVRRWQLVVVKCLASQGEQQRLSQFLGNQSPKPAEKQSKEQQKENGSQKEEEEEEADFAVMIKGAPEVILRCIGGNGQSIHIRNLKSLLGGFDGRWAAANQRTIPK